MFKNPAYKFRVKTLTFSFKNVSKIHSRIHVISEIFADFIYTSHRGNVGDFHIWFKSIIKRTSVVFKYLHLVTIKVEKEVSREVIFISGFFFQRINIHIFQKVLHHPSKTEFRFCDYFFCFQHVQISA